MARLPERVGRYVVDRELGRGGMGVIYKAHDPDIDRPVAIKLIRADLLSDEGREDFIVRFRREAQAAGRCAHPNIVGVYDIGLDNGDPFIAMEFVEGTTLGQELARGTRFAMPEAVGIVQQVLAALGCAHGNGVIHRDIKPANVLLQGGRVKVMDFGIARLDASDLTQVGSVVGSLHYMSPEQCQGDPVDHRSDLFSVGTMLYLLLTGKLPFDGGSFTQIAYRLVNQDPPDLRDYLSTAPTALAAVLKRSLAKRPGDRYAGAAAMSEALRQALVAGTAEMDATLRSPETAAVTASHNPTFSLPPETLAQVERDTAHYLGPIAKILVKRTLAKSGSLQAFRSLLAAHVEKDADRTAFLARLPR